MAIIKKYTSEDNDMGQLDFLYSLFDDFVSSDEGRDFDFDNGLVCRWMNGQASVAKLSAENKNLYPEQKAARKEMIDLLTAKNNVERFLEIKIEQPAMEEKKQEARR